MFQPAHIQHSSCICMTWIIMYILIQEVCGLIKRRLDSLKAGSSPTQQKKKDAAFYCLEREGGWKEKENKVKNRKKRKEQAGEKNIDYMNAGNVSCHRKPDDARWYKSGTVLNIFHSMNDECPFVSKNQNLSERDEGKFYLTTISSFPFQSCCMLIGQIS